MFARSWLVVPCLLFFSKVLGGLTIPHAYAHANVRALWVGGPPSFFFFLFKGRGGLTIPYAHAHTHAHANARAHRIIGPPALSFF